jgi:hypothetical protein
MAIFSSGKLDRMARETLVLPPPEPPVTPIIIGFLGMVNSYLIIVFRIYSTLNHDIIKANPYRK